MKLKRTLLLVFFLMGGAVLGALLATALADVSWLGWLAFSRSIGISPEAPFVLDLSVIRFSFGFQMQLSVAQILMIGLSIIGYNMAAKRL